MAETCKILSPQKKVYLSHSEAGCPMAEQMDKEMIAAYKEAHPERTVVAYINTTADLKTVCDVCVTSASALKIVNALDNDKILFIPDQNLGAYVKENCPDKDVELMQGGCPVHARLTEQEVLRAKELHPDAKVLVHPECRPVICQYADYIGSTTGIMNYAKESEAKEFIIGTENSIVQHLQMDLPEKRFYELSKECICRNMKLTTLANVYNILKYDEGEEIVMDEEKRLAAKKCIDKMLELGG
nr:quinolinate synthase NadA [Lachnospiraceae bacterium]